MYEVIMDSSIIKFEDRVMLFIKDGWKCQGGICCAGDYFCQAMVKKIENE